MFLFAVMFIIISKGVFAQPANAIAEHDKQTTLNKSGTSTNTNDKTIVKDNKEQRQMLNFQIPMAISSLYFPPNVGDWKKIDISTTGWDLDILNDALNYAKEQRSSGVIILLNGKILVERYWDVKATGFFKSYNKLVYSKTKDGRVIEDVASVQKSIISVLSGIGQRKGILDFDASVDYYLGEKCSKAPRQKEKLIKIKHLLSMTSGLKSSLRYKSPAGQEWKYNTRSYSKLIKVLETVARTDINQLSKDWLIGPVGMTESIWEKRKLKGLFSLFFKKKAGSGTAHKGLFPRRKVITIATII